MRLHHMPLSLRTLAVLIIFAAGTYAQQSLEVSPSQTAFQAVRNGSDPPVQFIAVTSDIAERLEFSITSDAAQWLTVTPTRGTTPARLQLSVNQADLPAGNYTARLVVASGDRRVPVDVTLSVEERAPALTAAPAVLRFGLAPVELSEQFLFITNAGSGSLPLRATVASGAEWLSVTPASGVASPDQPALLRVSVNRSAARTADYGTVLVQSGTQSIEVPVLLLREREGPALGLNLTGMRFEARQGEGHANNRNVLVLNLGAGSLNWQAEVVRGGDWLRLNPARGTATPEEFGRLGFNVEPGALSPGPYYALVRVSAPDAANSPQYISAVLNVSSAEDSPDPDPSPQGLFFAAAPGDPPPDNQPIRVFVSSNTPVPFQASASTADGAAWLRVDPPSGVTSTAGTTTLRVTVDPSLLQPGIYQGDVTIAFANRTIRTTNITLVAPGRTAAAARSKGPRAADGCAPTRLSLTQTGLVNSFSSTAGWPAPLIVRLADNCGDPVLDASMVASFSNGDPPLPMRLTNPQVGLYSATWLPQRSGDAVVTATAASPSLGTARTAIIGSVLDSREAPVLYPGAVLSILRPEFGAPLAPGTPVQVYGEHFTAEPTTAGQIPLPQALGGASLLIGAREAPLFYASPGQLNAQVPPDLPADAQYSTVILSGDRYTVADPVVVVSARPALATAAGAVVAWHSDSSPISAASPARAGEEITLVAGGLGTTEPSVAGGSLPSQSVTAQVRTPVQLNIGGRMVTVRSVALAPDLIGVYRVIFTLPDGLPAGSHPVVIEQDGVRSNDAVIRVGP